MKQVIKTIPLFLTHSVLTLVAISVLATILFFVQIFGAGDTKSDQDIFLVPLTTNGILSFFIGIYLGAVLVEFRESYLWIINTRYRRILCVAFLGLIGICSLIQAFIMFYSPLKYDLIRIAPFCVAILSSQILLGKNWKTRLLPLATFLILVQLYRWGADLEFILIGLLCASSLVIYSLFTSRFYDRPNSQYRKVKIQPGSFDMQSSWLKNYYIWLGSIAAKRISRETKSHIDWAIFYPGIKFPFISFVCVGYIFVVMFFMNSWNKLIFETMLTNIMAVLIVIIFMQSRFLIRQVREFAHVYSGRTHNELKRSIMRSMDKTIIVNSIIYVIVALLCAAIFNIIPLNQTIFIAPITVILSALSFYPMLFCLERIKLIMGVSAYCVLIILANEWLKNHTLDERFSMISIVFIGGLIGIRLIAQSLFINRPIEKLLKGK